jgi:hypothetical protein
LIFLKNNSEAKDLKLHKWIIEQIGDSYFIIQKPNPTIEAGFAEIWVMRQSRVY